jgi:hypothetical protein
MVPKSDSQLHKAAGGSVQLHLGVSPQLKTVSAFRPIAMERDAAQMWTARHHSSTVDYLTVSMMTPLDVAS